MDLKQMIDRNPNVDNSFCRGAVIFIVQNEWELHFRKRIGKLIESIKPNLKANSALVLIVITLQMLILLAGKANCGSIKESTQVRSVQLYDCVILNVNILNIYELWQSLAETRHTEYQCLSRCM
jgi:hypothetical protein